MREPLIAIELHFLVEWPKKFMDSEIFWGYLLVVDFARKVQGYQESITWLEFSF